MWGTPGHTGRDSGKGRSDWEDFRSEGCGRDRSHACNRGTTGVEACNLGKEERSIGGLGQEGNQEPLPSPSGEDHEKTDATGT